MDTSETYIKMRMAAIPYLGMGELPLEPCHFKKATLGFVETICIDAKGDWYHFTEDEACQLERQDQLQEMMEEEYAINLLYDFHRFYNVMGCDLYPHTIGNNLSVEQLWLAFVMKEKYNKVWNGEVWTDSC